MSDRFKFIPDYVVTARVQILAEKLDFNHALLNIPAMWTKTRGSDVKIVVLDTGVPNHIDINQCGGASFIDNYEEDKNGHATHCGGIIGAIAGNGMGCAGIAPDAEDYYCAVLDGSGSGSIDAIIKGIYWAVDVCNADIISMSLGVATQRIYRELEAACDYAVSKGVAIFAAAGNEAGKVGQPAMYDSTIAVAAVNSRMEHARFSNTGPEVDFAAGGVDVYSAYLNNGYAKLSGTSMACPALAALGALVLADHKLRGEKLTPQQLRKHLRKISYDVGDDGFDELYGFGIPIFAQQVITDVPPIPGDTPIKEPRLWEKFVSWLRNLFSS